MRGSVEPRLATEPLRDLADPAASFGHLVVDFAERIGRPLDPWQQVAVIRGGELRADGTPRFRKVLLCVSRQAGKTTLLSVLSLFWLAVDIAHLDEVAQPLVLGTSTKLDTARESWDKAVLLARRSPLLSPLIPAKGGVRRANGEVTLTLGHARYRIAAATGDAGRGLTVHRAILDELREHGDYDTWDAIVPAQDAVHDAQLWALSNAGHDRSLVLNDQRAQALAEVDRGGDLCLLEWSAPDGSSPLDLDALCMANPTLGTRNRVDTLLADAQRAVERGGDVLTGFKTERMCMRVRNLDPAIDPDRWVACAEAGTLDDVRSRVVLCLDVSIDQQHATVVAAATLDDGRVRVEPVRAWDGPGCAREAVRALPGLVSRVRPRAVGWFPGGPAASLAADLADRKGRSWPPPGVLVEEIRSEVTAVCMGLADLVTAGQVVHADDPLLNAQVAIAERLQQGDAWRFTRKGTGCVDAVYAAAGAVHLARTAPAPVGLQRIVLPRTRR